MGDMKKRFTQTTMPSPSKSVVVETSGAKVQASPLKLQVSVRKPDIQGEPLRRSARVVKQPEYLKDYVVVQK
jgi:hypothetical protein